MPEYSLEFNAKALKEWNKLDPALRLQFAKKLKERLQLPRVEADGLRGLPDCYKIKLKASGYRLVYEVLDKRVVVVVLALGKRERSQVYLSAKQRHGSLQK